jgi:hypothetical protein
MLRKSVFSAAALVATTSAQRQISRGTTTMFVRGVVGGSMSYCPDIARKEIAWGEDIAECKAILDSRNIRDKSIKLIAALLNNKDFRLEQMSCGNERIIFQNLPQNKREEVLLEYCSILSTLGIKGRLYMNTISGESRIDLSHSRQDLLNILSGVRVATEQTADLRIDENSLKTRRR